jgi:parallel beta-helix repeat protein
MTEAGVILDHVDSSSQVVDTVIDGTLDPGPPVQSVKDNAARNIVGIQIIDSFDNCTPSTCGSISGNTIQRLVTGIHVRGASDPRILDNVITENIWGIWLQQTSTGAPNPVINQNRIFDNHGQTFVPYKDLEEDQTFRLCSTQGGSNLCLSDYSTTGTTTVIDAQQNYWGVLTPDEVRASVKITEGERVAVDVSQFTDGQQPPNIIGPANLLSAVMVDISAAASGPGTLQDVGGPVIRPSIVDTDRLAISYSLQRAANVLVEIFRESDNTLTATPLYSFPLQSRAAGGPYTQLWDGKDSSQHWVPDGAYAFVITAKDPMSGSVLDRYDPPANQDVRNESAPSNYKTLIGDRGAGDRGVGTLSTFNSFVNDYLTYNYVLNDYPAFGHGKFSSKVTAKVYYRATGTGDCDAAGNLSGGVLIATPWVNKPLWVASHVFVWDGRADHAVGSFEPGQLIPEVVQTPSDGPDFCVFFEVPQALKPSHVIVANTQPTITGTGLAPEIEVRADPYLIQPTYDQSSKLEFKIDQDSYVTLLIFPPGQQSVDDGDAISIIPIDGNPTTVDVDAVPGNTAFPYYWKGHADGVGESRKLSATYNGPFTFALKAVNARDSTLTSVYRGVINVRGEGEAH